MASSLCVCGYVLASRWGICLALALFEFRLDSDTLILKSHAVVRHIISPKLLDSAKEPKIREAEGLQTTCTLQKAGYQVRLD